MKRILAVFDGLDFSEYTMGRAIYLAQKYNAHITAIFIQEINNWSTRFYENLLASGTARESMLEELEDRDEAAFASSVSTFEKTCCRAKVSYAVYKDRGTALSDLMHESVYADVLLLDKQETFSVVEENLPGCFVRNLLHEVCCPVWVVAAKAMDIRKIVWLNEGGPASVYALKMLTYLFPDWHLWEILSIQIGQEGGQSTQDSLDWIRATYPQVRNETWNGTKVDWMERLRTFTPDHLIVSGNYRRSQLSYWLTPGLVDEMLREIRVPMFITHF